MPALFIFLLKVNAALLLFCAGYYLVLRYLTFYTLNRIYLVAAILFASIYPKINLSDFVERHQQIAKPVQAVVLNWQPTAAVIAKPLAIPVYWHWIELIFWMGAALLAVRLLVQLHSLFKLYRKSTAAQINNHNVRVIDGDAGPFSFWKSIYINPANHSAEDLKAILLHEQVHVNEWHTLDILLAEMSTIFYWFNPGVWLMKKAVRENIEFITDNKILKAGADSKQYQYSLVNVSFAAQPNTIVNHFNISTIKKRIIMMNAKRSSKINLTRYAFLVPAVVALLLVFTISKAAYVKKGSIAFHHFTDTFKNNKAIKTTKPAIIKNDAEEISIIRDTVNTTLADTGKKNKLTLRLAKITADNAIYIIDGKTSKDTSFKELNLNPSDIQTINVTKTDANKGVIYIQTKKSASDNSLDKVIVTGHAGEPVTYVVDGKILKDVELKSINPANIATINVDKPSGSNGVIYIETKKRNDSKSSNISINGQSVNQYLSLELTKNIADTIKSGGKIRVINRHIPTDTLYFTDPSGAKKHLQFNKLESFTITSDTDKKHAFTAFASLYSRAKVSGLTYTSSPFENSKFSLNHLSDKLIIINGKIATEKDLKKLSAFDIDRMVLKTDEETKELYGDKAKNGIVFIVTRKKAE